MTNIPFKSHLIRQSLWLILLALPLNLYAETSKWTYQKEQDSLTNQTFSYARSPLPARGQYDNIRVEIVCKQNKLQFVVDGGSLIASQNETFSMDYQIDQRPAIALTLQTFPDSKQQGFTEANVNQIVAEVLSGQSIFIRINTMIQKVLTGLISLNDASTPIQQVLADCGVNNVKQSGHEPEYSMEQFQQDFKQVPSNKQAQLLQKIKGLFQEFK
jgi:hypothetical protein